MGDEGCEGWSVSIAVMTESNKQSNRPSAGGEPVRASCFGESDEDDIWPPTLLPLSSVRLAGILQKQF